MTLLQLFNKSKPQNFLFPLQNLLSQTWKCYRLQLTFIKNCIFQYTSNKSEKTIQFNKLKNRVQSYSEVKPECASEFTDVWQSVELVERLVVLSCRRGMFKAIRAMFDEPIQKLPEYLLFALSLAKPSCGHNMLDELFSNLMPVFFGNHSNSSFVLGQLFQLN